MKYSKVESILFLFIPIFIAFHPVPAFTETVQTKTLIDSDGGPIIIKSNMLEVDNKRYTVTFTGDVDVKKDDLTINCQKILLYYENMPAGSDPADMQASINKIIAEGEVKISRASGGLATAEKAVYYNDDEKLVLTGNPVIKQGEGFVEGARITLFLKENRSIVEGSGDDKAKAVLYPKKKR